MSSLRTGEDSLLSVSFQIFLTIACLLAAIGAITDSPVTVVGAMVLGPEFGPLAALAVGLVLRRRDLLTTVPAAAFASVALVEHRYDEALSSAVQLFRR